MLNQYKLVLISFFLYLIYLSKNGYIFLFLNNDNLKLFKKSILNYPQLNELILNYSGKCGKIFKYKKNNKRDLVMFAYEFIQNDFYSKRSILIFNIINSIKKNIPNAKIICFIPNNSKINLVIKILKKNNVLIIKKKDFMNMNLVSSRFMYEYEYLKKNINLFDRVIHADLTDIFFFSDIFQTLKSNELIINKECQRNSKFGLKGNFILSNYKNSKWFIRSFGDNKTIVKLFKRINPIIINAGLIMGDSKEYLKLLKIMKDNINYSKASYHGYDQMLFNVLYYTGKLKSINIKFDLCTQRSCFCPNLIFNKENKKFHYKNGCSPVLIHKSYPTN